MPGIPGVCPRAVGNNHFRVRRFHHEQVVLQIQAGGDGRHRHCAFVRAPDSAVAETDTVAKAISSASVPLLFARVAADGTVDPANSQGVTSGNVTKPLPAGLYCFSGLPAIKGGQITPEIVAGELQFEFGQLGFGNVDSLCPPATQFFVTTISRDAAGVLSFGPGSFFLHLY